MKRKFLKFFAVFEICLSIGQLFEARKRFLDPAPLWMGVDQWYDEVVKSILCAIIAGACIAYDIRVSLQEREAASGVRQLRRRARWRELRELRFVMYSFAIAQLISLPLTLIHCSIEYLSVKNGQMGNSFWSLFPASAMIAPLVGIAIIIYDRHRLKKEQWKDTGACMKCGYDLRATLERCPECGTIPLKKPTPERASPEKLASVYDDTDSTSVN